MDSSDRFFEELMRKHGLDPVKEVQERLEAHPDPTGAEEFANTIIHMQEQDIPYYSVAMSSLAISALIAMGVLDGHEVVRKIDEFVADMKELIAHRARQGGGHDGETE